MIVSHQYAAAPTATTAERPAATSNVIGRDTLSPPGGFATGGRAAGGAATLADGWEARLPLSKIVRHSSMDCGRSAVRMRNAQSTASDSDLEYLPRAARPVGSRRSSIVRSVASLGTVPVMPRYSTPPMA